MFRPEDSHFVLYNTSLIKTENKISFNSQNKSIEITYFDSSNSKYFNGNKTGSLKYDDSIYYIEFSTEDYFIEVYFNKNDFFPSFTIKKLKATPYFKVAFSFSYLI